MAPQNNSVHPHAPHTISKEQMDQLQDCYREGLTCDASARRCSVSRPTVIRYFQRFAALRIPRGEVERSPGGRRAWPEPYTGPDWIGKPATNIEDQNGKA